MGEWGKGNGVGEEVMSITKFGIDSERDERTFPLESR